MAAYAATASLMHILDLLKNNPSPPISLDKQQSDSLTEIVSFLQEFLEGYVSPFSYSDEADPLEIRIAEAVYAAEDVIESYIVDNIHLAAASSTKDDDFNHYYLNPFDKYYFDSDDNGGDNDHDDNDDGDGDDHDDDEEDRDVDNDDDENSDDDDGNGNGGNNDDDDDKENGDSHDNNDDDGEEMESYIVDNIQLAAAAAAHEEDEQICYINFYQGLQKVIEAMDMIKKETVDTERKRAGVKAELQSNVLTEAVSKSSSTESKKEMVGFEDELLQIKEMLVGGDSNRRIIPIIGMGGIGKTTLARNVFADKLIVEHFDICLWATISQDYNIEQTLREVLSSQGRGNSGVAGLGEELHKYLFGRRYLVVLDDMWSVEVWDKMRFFFPDCGKRSRVIVTTRMSNLASHLSNSSNNSLCMSFLNKVDSWTLFSKAVFGDEESFSYLDELGLREIGEKIVAKCKGLPLSIDVIGGLLARSERTQGYWEYIEKNLSRIVNLENEEYCLRVLKLSYNHLPAYLKPCFLYMGMFDEDREIKVSKILHLWVSEGFLKPKKGKKNSETIARECLQELIDRNLVLVVDESSRYLFESNCELGSVGDDIKLCKMHDLVRDLSLREAQKQRFYYVCSKDHNHPNSHRHHHSHRRIVIPKQTGGIHKPKLMLESSSNPRSYVSHDDFAQLFPDFRLLRTLHMVNYGSYHVYSQKEVFGLVNARLLSISIEDNWPHNVLGSSISRLWSLHTLILHSKDDFYGPIAFWNMHQLKHVEFIGLRLRLPLPPPNNGNNIVILENLHTLIGMVDFCLNEDVVRRLPNLRILDVSYLEEKIVSRKVHCLSFLQRLSKLESFGCSIEQDSGENLQRVCFPRSLKQILLTRSSYAYYKKIELEGILQKLGCLPFLEEVVIEYGVFGRGEWETIEGQFPILKTLELYRCHNLKKWTALEASHFPLLEKLRLCSLDELEEIPSEIGEIATLKLIVVNMCGISAALSAKKIVEEQEELCGEDQLSFRVQVLCDGDALLKSLATPNFQVEFKYVV